MGADDLRSETEFLEESESLDIKGYGCDSGCGMQGYREDQCVSWANSVLNLTASSSGVSLFGADGFRGRRRSWRDPYRSVQD